MTREQWAKVGEIFSAAREESPERREAFLEEACPDVGLQAEVRKLLQADDTPSLESPFARVFAPQDNVPAVIGRYHIVRMLGAGGMGAVYEAEQDQPRRRVAIKAIKPGLANPALLRRFEHETRALGLLQHPGIAQIYEAGTADWGFGPQPYFAMEFIQGATLLRYAEKQQLGVRRRLELIVKVCEAVQHAHQRGIIHRDLKPGNILVDEAGQPKIVDFGVARVTDADARASRATDIGQVLGTLAYMSPEQVLGDPADLDTRSDVYALGVILYELLAARLPYEIGDQLTMAAHTICEVDPVRLSSINRTYRGDIETIVGKALEKDKARRYSSAAELGADIQRFLRDEPIVARRSSAAYHLRKFARRHRVLVTSIIVAFVMLTAGVIASTWEAARAWNAEQEAFRQRDAAAVARQAAQAERDRAIRAEQTAVAEEQRADTESATAKTIADFLQNDLLSQSSPHGQARSGAQPDPELKVRAALDRAAERVAGRFEKQPLVEAAIRQTIGQAYLDLGVLPEARRQIERALELRRRTLGEQHRDTLEAEYRLVTVYRDEGSYDQAEPLLTKLVAARSRILGPEHPDTLNALQELAMLYRATARYDKAESLLRWLVAVRLRVSGEDHPDTLDAMSHLGRTYISEAKYTLAEPLYRELIEKRRRVLGEEHPDTLTSMEKLADVYRLEKRYAPAEPLFLKVLEMRRRTLGPENPDTTATMIDLANLYISTARFAEAESLLTQVVDIGRRLNGGTDPDTLNAMADLATIYRKEHRDAEAEPLSVKILEVRRRTLGTEHPNTLLTMNNLALEYMAEGEDDKAEPLLLQTVETRRRVSGEDHIQTLNAEMNLAELYRREGKYSLAEPLYLQVFAARRRALGEDDPATMIAQTGLAVVYRWQGRFAEAEPINVKVLEASRRVLGEEHRETLLRMTTLGSLYLDEGNYSKAEPLLAKALFLDRRVLGAASATTKLCQTSLAKLRLGQHQYAEAESLLRESLKARDKEGPSSWQPSERRSLLGLSLMEQSKFSEAEPLLISGYQGLVQRKSAIPQTVSLREAGERVVKLYTAWEKPDEAARWRKELQTDGSQPQGTRDR